MANFQANLNTVLLGLCVTGIAWTLKSINELDSQMAAQEVNVSDLREDIKSINDVNNDHSKAIQDLNGRLLKLELLSKPKP